MLSNSKVLFIAAAISAACTLLHAIGWLETVERELLKQRFALVQHAASGEIVLVEIDRESIEQIGVWPWPRRHHAIVLERLRSAGAAAVFFDVDFSSLQASQDDLILSRALERAGPLAHLAVFSDSSGDGHAPVDIGPPDHVLDAATPVSVNMSATDDGNIWSVVGTRQWRGTDIPGMFEAMAGAPDSTMSFWIDYGINPETVPVLSFAAVAVGAFDPEAVRGRRVVIGATAIELGDKFASPRGLILPGAVVQILAAESLVNGRALVPAPIALSVLLTFLGSSAALFGVLRRRWHGGIAASVLVAVAIFGLAVAVQASAPILIWIAPPIVAVGLSTVIGFAGRAQSLDLRLWIESLRLRRANAVMSRVAANMQDGLLTLDGDGRIETANRAASRTLGLAERDLAGRPIADFSVWPRLRNLAQLRRVLVEAMARGGPARVICRSNEGRIFYGEVTLSKLPEEFDERWIVVVRDATQKVQADRLARRRERDLRNLKIKAELATRAKTEFVATMSHELRTPLNAIVGCATILNSEQFGELAGPYKTFAGEIVQGGARLERLLSHVLDYANADMDLVDLELQECDPRQLICDVIRLQSKRAEAAAVTVSFKEPPDALTIRLDPVAFQKAVGNILANAIRFNRSGGWVRIGLDADAFGAIEVRVEDSGIGIHAELIPKCFEPFFQVDQSERRALDGAGLGLTVAQKFVRLHGGDVVMTSEPDAGTCVRVLLPAR